MTEKALDGLRERIRQLDLELLAHVTERVELARQLGELKRRQRRPTVDYAQERVVLDRARSVARERGLDPVIEVDGEVLADFGAEELADWWREEGFEPK